MLYDIVIRNGTLVTAAETAKADLAIADGRIAAIGCALGRGREEIDATGLFVLPGVDAHCHVDEPPFLGARLADGFESATRSAACGGTTTIVPFVNQLGRHAQGGSRGLPKEGVAGDHRLCASRDPHVCLAAASWPGCSSLDG